MKTILLSVLLTLASLVLAASANACGPNRNQCSTDSNGLNNNFAPTNANFQSPFANVNAANRTTNFAPSSPQSRLTVLPSTPADVSGTTSAPATTENVGNVHVISDDTTLAPKPLPKVEPLAKPVTATAADPKPIETPVAKTESSKADDSKIAKELESLVGTWMAVARHGDGELTTVELELDSKGWAKLTVPSASGSPSTITRRVELKDKELSLAGPDGALALGKLVEFNSRQLVLDRDGGQVTFVRP